MMAELQAFQAITGSLRSAGEIAKALISLKVAADVQAKIIELNGAILAAQSDALSAQATQMELLGRIGELEGKLKGVEDWDAEKQRYSMVNANNVSVYVLKKSAMQSGEVPHAACPNCYQRKQKAILQPLMRSQDGGFGCTACKATYRFWDLPEQPD